MIHIIVNNIKQMEGLEFNLHDMLKVKYFIKDMVTLTNGDTVVVLEMTDVEGPY